MAPTDDRGGYRRSLAQEVCFPNPARYKLVTRNTRAAITVCPTTVRTSTTKEGAVLLRDRESPPRPRRRMTDRSRNSAGSRRKSRRSVWKNETVYRADPAMTEPPRWLHMAARGRASSVTPPTGPNCHLYLCARSPPFCDRAENITTVQGIDTSKYRPWKHSLPPQSRGSCATRPFLEGGVWRYVACDQSEPIGSCKILPVISRWGDTSRVSTRTPVSELPCSQRGTVSMYRH